MKHLRLLLLACVLAVPALAQAALPDPVRFGARMELGNVELAREWLDGGLDPDFVADRIGTGLMIAAWSGNIPLLELFAARGADIHKRNGFGEDALMHAAWRGQTEAVKWLLARGARLNREGLEWTALHYAVFAGHGELARLLLERGADINARSSNGSSVLMMAVYEGHEDLARLLVERGADRAIRNERGDNALSWAVKFNHANIARLVGSREEVAAAVARPRPVVAQRSQGAPQEAEDVEELLRIRRLLEARGLSLDVVDSRVAAQRARLARASLREARAARMPALEISAKRGAPAEQRMELIYR